MRKLTIIFLIILFALFCAYLKLKQTEYTVLQVISPTDIVIDYNKNGKAEPNEHYTLNLISFSSANINEDTCKYLNISTSDYLRLVYLTDKFVNKFFSARKIDIINNKIYVNGKNYEEALLDNGLAIRPDEKLSSKVKENIKNAQKTDLVIYNPKSNVYHKLDCKYGIMTKNMQILPLSMVRKDSNPCSFCLPKKIPLEMKYDEKFEIAKLKPPSLDYISNNIKIFITDFEIKKPEKACKTSACRALTDEINSAKSSIDFAIYGYTEIPAIKNALKRAEKRGVKIRFVYDTNNGQNIYPDTFSLAETFKYNNSDVVPAIMHNKFFVFDNKKVFTGSANISNTDMSSFNSNISVLINSVEIAQAYAKEFEQMYLGKFHKHKMLVEKTSVLTDDAEISCYFSPRDNIIKIYILPLISNAHSYIYIPSFLLTHYGMTEALIKAKKRGVDVKIILDATNVHKKSRSKIKELRAANIPVKTEIFAGKLHSKTILIDDEYTIIGSMNFSKAGEAVNDENVLIIKNSEITSFCKNYFLYLWKKIPSKWLKLYARAEAIESVGSCSDGLDNDFDGKIDMEDSGCYLKLKNKKVRK